jgi:hypothetical protein
MNLVIIVMNFGLRMKKNGLILCLFLFVFSLSSCDINEGPGGTSTITGKVWVLDYNAEFTYLYSEYWAEDEDVFIIYGNDTIFSDDTKTGYDGSYRFQYLQEGNYTIYCMSKDTTGISSSGNIVKKASVLISDNGDEIVVPTITIVN